MKGVFVVLCLVLCALGERKEADLSEILALDLKVYKLLFEGKGMPMGDVEGEGFKLTGVKLHGVDRMHQAGDAKVAADEHSYDLHFGLTMDDLHFTADKFEGPLGTFEEVKISVGKDHGVRTIRYDVKEDHTCDVEDSFVWDQLADATLHAKDTEDKDISDFVQNKFRSAINEKFIGQKKGVEPQFCARLNTPFLSLLV